VNKSKTASYRILSVLPAQYALLDVLPGGNVVSARFSSVHAADTGGANGHNLLEKADQCED
jgi:hypothetical protein